MNLHDALAKVHRKREPLLASVATPASEVSPELVPVYDLLRDRGRLEVHLVSRLGMWHSLSQVDDPRRHRWLNRRYDGEVYHADDVRQVCVHYRMRMLPSHRYRGPIDPEFGVKLNRFRREHQLTDGDLERDFFVVAPAETFDLEKRQRPLVDPLLLYRIDAQHYKLVHQWGGDLHPLRYLRAWRHRSLTTMTLYWTLFTFVLTLGLFGALAESVTNALTISGVFTFLVGWGYYSTLRDSYEEQRHRFSEHNWDQDWVF